MMKRFLTIVITSVAAYVVVEWLKGTYSCETPLLSDSNPPATLTEEEADFLLESNFSEDAGNYYPEGWKASKEEILSLTELLIDEYLRKLGKTKSPNYEPGEQLDKALQISIQKERIDPLYQLFVKKQDIVSESKFEKLGWATVQFGVNQKGELIIDLEDLADGVVAIGKKREIPGLEYIGREDLTQAQQDELNEGLEILAYIFTEVFDGLEDHIIVAFASYTETPRKNGIKAYLESLIKDLGFAIKNIEL